MPVAGLWAPALRMQTLYLWLLWSFNSFTFYALANWLPTVLASNGFALDTALRLASLTWGGGIAGGLLLAWSFDRLNCRRLVTASALLAGALLLLALNWTPPTVRDWGVLLAGIGMAIGGMQSMIPAIAARLYPPAILATGLSWGGAVGRSGALLAPLLGAAATDHRPAGGLPLPPLAVPAAVTAAIVARLFATAVPVPHPRGNLLR